MSEVVETLDAHMVLPFPIPHDFTDGFQIAYWRRPELYLDLAVRQAGSTFAQLPPSVVEPAMEGLRADLDRKPAEDYSVPASSVSLATSLEPEKHRR
ncbi:hypothetical protein [Streptomyces atratus]|uniref:hypothetical protein n=1 Tax=Streptomyces atratus TaxID=1893 RepID=UPI00224D2B38|nr:hypothetical protein [Streptomyces atratus]MCX5345306.1 hypothetical protein [Streptomyces atratus]